MSFLNFFVSNPLASGADWDNDRDPLLLRVGEEHLNRLLAETVEDYLQRSERPGCAVQRRRLVHHLTLAPKLLIFPSFPQRAQPLEDLRLDTSTHRERNGAEIIDGLEPQTHKENVKRKDKKQAIYRSG